MNINVGDTVVIRGTVEMVSGCEYDALFPLLATVKIPGMVKNIVVPASVFSEVIPKPRIPKVGETWVDKKCSTSKRKVYYVDDAYVVYENISKGENNVYKKTIDYFITLFRPE